MMKYLRFSLLFLVVACSAPKVVYDYDTKVDFSKYKTFDFYDEMNTGLNELDTKRLTEMIRGKLTFKGLQQSNTPDFFINLASGMQEVYNKNTVGVGIGGGGRNVGIGVSGQIPIGGNQINQDLIFEFVDAKTNQLFWQGIITSSTDENMTPQEREAYLGMIVDKVLSGYPPVKKKK